MEPARRPPGRASTSWRRSTTSGADRAARPGSATTSTRIGRRSRPIRRTRRRRKEELVARATRTSCAPGDVAPRVFGRAAQGGLRRPARRAVQGEGRAVRVLLPADARRLAPRHLLRQHVRPAEPDVLEARVDDVPRGDPRAPLPDRARDGAPDAQRVPPARRAVGPAPSSRAGACTRAPRRRARAVPQPARSGSGCSTRRRGARRG